MTTTQTSIKTTSHVFDISLRSDNGTFSLEVRTEFFEKQITELLPVDESVHTYSRKRIIEDKLLRRWETTDSYPLLEITIPELVEHRLSKVPGIVYKKDNKFFYASIPGTLSLNGKFGRHACGKQCTMVCKGCPRTTALTVAYQERYGKSFREAVKDSWRIEKFDFVVEGLEAFNMNASNDAFIVLQCENYGVRFTDENAPKKTTAQLAVGLAQFVWEDFNGTTLKEVRNRIHKNEIKNFGQSSLDVR